MAALRGIADSSIACPSYTGAHAVFEIYTVSLGKHQAMIALVFAYFAAFGSSKAAITIGLAYWAVAGTLDIVPVVTWFAANGLVTSSFPGIVTLALVFVAVAAVGVPTNHRNREWSIA